MGENPRKILIPMESILIEHSDGRLLIDEIGEGRRRLTVTPASADVFVHEPTCTTAYPVDLIQAMLETHGVGGLCFEIMREEDPSYIERLIRNDIFAYFDRQEIDGMRILDFGCGDGAATFILSRMFPKSEIIGVELVPGALAIARKRAAYYQNPRVTFIDSPIPDTLPHNLGSFDFIVMSAVYEHLLPDERPSIMRKLWKRLNDGGHLFLNQTPNGLFPVELHTTMLPLINYLPDNVTLLASRKFSRKTKRDESWEMLLRKGIRGATEWEIHHLLGDERSTAVMLEPSRDGLRDRIDLYYKNTNSKRLRTVKSAARIAIKLLRKTTGIAMIPDLSLAFKKMPRLN